jgi:hypothetical protein
MLPTKNFTAQATAIWSSKTPKVNRNQFLHKQHFHACVSGSRPATTDRIHLARRIRVLSTGTLCEFYVLFGGMVNEKFTVANREAGERFGCCKECGVINVCRS